MLNRFLNSNGIFMFLAKIIASGTPILIIEILRRNHSKDFIGYYQNTISLLEIFTGIFLLGTGQYFIKNKVNRKIVLKYFLIIINLILVCSLTMFERFIEVFVFLVLFIGLRFFSSFLLSKKKYIIAAFLNNNLILFIIILLGVLFYHEITLLFLKDIFEFSSSTFFFKGLTVMFFIIFSFYILKDTYTFFLPRVLNIIQSNIDMVILPIYIDMNIFAAYVVLTRWSKLISFPLTIGVNYLLPLYGEIINNKEKKVLLLKKYFYLSISYSLLSGLAVIIYLSFTSDYNLNFILIAVCTSILNLLFGPLGIPIIQGNNRSRLLMTSYSFFDGIIFIIIIIINQNNLLSLLLIYFFRMLFFNLWKFNYVKKNLW